MGSAMIIATVANGQALAQTATTAQQSSAETSDTVASGSEAPAPAPAEADITVTGTRVERSGFSAPTPVTILGDKLLVERAPSVLIDAIALLPAARNSSTPQTAGSTISGAGGGSFVNLRGLGPTRTLILINGQRMIPTTNIGTVDIAVIPQILVKRIDIVTGGASAAYGSDAVAGVANFVLDTNLSGARANVEAGISSRGDAATHKFGLAWGGALAEGIHLVAGGEYYHGSPLETRERNYLAYPVGNINNPNFTAGGDQKPLVAAPYVYYNNMTLGGLIPSGPLANTQFLPGGATTTYAPCGPVTGLFQACPQQRNDLVSFQRSQDILAAQRRYSGYAGLGVDISPDVKLNADFLYGKSTTVFHSIPPATTALGTYTIQRDNAYLPSAVAARLDAAGVTSFPLARYSEEFGRSEFARTAEVKRGTLSLDAKLGGSWKLQAYGLYAESNFKSRYNNALIPSLFNQAVDAVVNPANGQIVCRSTLANPTNGCVPINLFGAGAPDLKAKSFAYASGLTELRNSQVASSVSISGEPFSTWAGPVSIVAGAEYRRDHSAQTVDALQLARLLAYSNNQPLRGSVNVKEMYLETVVPLAKDIPFAKTLELNGAVRRTDYSTTGGVTTWKVGGNYEPFDGLRFRTVRSRDIRAPNILELNSPRIVSNAAFPVTDPKTNTPTNAVVYSSGNAFLRPEVASTFTAGVVARPAFLGNFNISLDYYDIKVKGAVQTLSAQQTLNECQAGNTTICNFVERNTAGSLVSVTTVFANLANIRTSGFDLETSYHVALGEDAIDLRVMTNYLRHYTVDTGTTKIDYAGDILTYGLPKWSWDFGAAYRHRDTYFNVDAQHTSKSTYSVAALSQIQNNVVEGRWYFNAGVQQTVKSGMGALTLYMRVDNLFDEKPPVLLPAPNFGGNYDRIGRYFKMGARWAL
jgi:outer membrane receptor protein involved in Fe transport